MGEKTKKTRSMMWALLFTALLPTTIAAFTIAAVGCVSVADSMDRDEQLDKWMEGKDSTPEVAPFGYAGNPKGYEAVSKISKELIEVHIKVICENF